MVTAIVLGAGNSSRMGKDKMKLRINGNYVLYHSVAAFANHPSVNKVIIVSSDLDFAKSIANMFEKDIVCVGGGSDRQKSAYYGLSYAVDSDFVLIHDGARPFVSKEVIDRCILSAKECGTGVPGIPIYDTIKRVDYSMDVIKTIDRSKTYVAQTPQCFKYNLILEAHHYAKDFVGTDDASLLEYMGEKVKIVMGDPKNIKITTAADIPNTDIRVGNGYDVHKLSENRKLILCGVCVPSEVGLLGHSDADVAVHALMDAMLGACGMDDIGTHFPDSNDEFKNISSLLLLKQVVELTLNKGYTLANGDLTIVCERPKLREYIEDMVENLAQVLGIGKEALNVKATTTEGLGFLGKGEGIACYASVLMRRI